MLPIGIRFVQALSYLAQIRLARDVEHKDFRFERPQLVLVQLAYFTFSPVYLRQAASRFLQCIKGLLLDIKPAAILLVEARPFCNISVEPLVRQVLVHEVALVMPEERTSVRYIIGVLDEDHVCIDEVPRPKRWFWV